MSVVETDLDEKRSDRQLELVEHLNELRSRVMRIAIYVCVGAVAGWTFYGFFFEFFTTPVMKILKPDGGKFLLTGVAEGFTIKMQVSLLIGIILAMPLITMEGWKFVMPGLTRSERRAVKLVAPLSIILFALGVVLAFYAMPMGIRWLVGQNPPEATFMPSVKETMMFILKMYLAFGLVFQMPVILMFLGKVGLVSSRTLKSYWRQAIVAIAIVAAAVTPSGDAFTMMMICVPMFALYILSIGLVKWVER